MKRISPSQNILIDEIYRLCDNAERTIRRLIFTTCALVAAPTFAHFDHEGPLPHALQSEFVELRIEVDDARLQVDETIRRIEEQLGETAAATAVASLSDAVATLDAAVRELDAKCCPEPDDDSWLAAILGAGAGALFGIGGIALFGRRLLGLPKTSLALEPSRSPRADEPAPSPTAPTPQKDPTGTDEPRDADDPDEEPTLRTVTASRRDDKGIVLAICNHDESWQERTVEQAIADMKTGIKYESLGPRSGSRAKIRFVERRGARPYLTTEGDDEDDNNLDNLPPC